MNSRTVIIILVAVLIVAIIGVLIAVSYAYVKAQSNPVNDSSQLGDADNAVDNITVQGNDTDAANVIESSAGINLLLPERLENYTMIFYYDDSVDTESVRLYVQNRVNTYWLKRGNEFELEQKLGLIKITPPYLVCLTRDANMSATNVTGKALREFLNGC